MSERHITLEVLRYRPESDSAPVFQTYRVPCREEWVVLDALNYVKDHLDRTLSYRWSCHMAVCGSCAMVINDTPMLSCKAFLRDLPGHIRVEALHHFPIERDLMVALDDFMDKLKSVKPYLIPKQPAAGADGAYRQSAAQLKKFKAFAMCINCMACYSVCPQYGLNAGFAGPAALALAHRYNADSRDRGRRAREDVVASNTGIWECTFVGACSDVCPKDVDPAAAIQQTKIASTVDYFRDLLMPWKRAKSGTGNPAPGDGA